MRTLSLVLLNVLLLWSVVTNAAELTIHLDNPPPKGIVAFVLFDSANSFGDLREPAKTVRLPLDGRDAYHIENIPPGEYALMVYYDENNNDSIDKNFIGIPREPIGFSNLYKPKGPPSFSKQAFMLVDEKTLHFDIKLYRPLGKFGQLGAGLGVIARSSPYRGYNGGMYKVIPAITYIGKRLQIYGPHITFALVDRGRLSLAAKGNYRIGAYKEDESDFLKGMGDRKDTFMAGLAIQAKLPKGIDLSTSCEYDILDEIGGGTARLDLKKSFQTGMVRFSPKISLNWLSSKLSKHDFGVPPDKATPERSAYDPGSTISIEGGLGMIIELTHNWIVIVNTSVEHMDNKVTSSPIVSEEYIIKGFGAINYIF